MKIHNKMFFILLTCLWHSTYAMQFLNITKQYDQKTNVVLPFLSNIEMRKKQISDLEVSLREIRSRLEELNKESSNALAQIQIEGTDIQKIGAHASEREIEYLNKKISTFNARKQNLINIQEVDQETVAIIEKRIEILKEILNYLQAPKIQPKPIYTWKEFQDAQIKTSEQIAQIETEKLKRENIKKQILAEKGTLLSLQKQLDAKEKERNKIINQTPSHDKDEEISTDIIRLESEVVDHEINLLNERIKFSNQKIEKLTEEEKLKETEFELLQLKINDQKNISQVIEKRLLLDSKDVEFAKLELKKETHISIDTKNELNKLREPKKYEKEKINIEINSLQDKIKQLTTKDKKDSYNIHITKSMLQRALSLKDLIERDLLLLDAKKDVADVKLKIKELQFKILELRYKLKTEKGNVKEYLATYKTQKELETSTLKSFKEKRIEAVNSLVETQREISGISSKIEKMHGSKASLINQQPSYLTTIINNLDDSRRILSDLSIVTQDFLAVCSDLIHQQTSVLNFYDLILTDLESYTTTQSIWKRTPTAISSEALKTSLIEAEDFAKKLFWGVPAHLSPLTILNLLKEFSIFDFLFTLLFILFAVTAFIFIKKWLVKISQKFEYKSQHKPEQSKRITYTISSTLLTFALEHYNLLFALISIYLYINLEYQIFTTQFLSIPFYTALFYLICIPFFVFISTQLLTTLKDLNKKLSFVFFAETIQDRFLVLISTFMYSSSIILPFRSAFLIYSDTKMGLGDVLMAGYSLILLLILLFLFTKEDLFKLLPYTKYPSVEWIKKKLEKFYYPIFFFIMGLLILRNPYVGYANLSWYLAFAIPASAALLWALFITHNYIRNYSVFLFMTEDEDEIKDKFEHAKTYYGILIIATFLFLFFIDIFFIARIWGYNYTTTEIWRLLSETWVIPFGDANKLGVVQFMTLATFVLSGFLTSSLLDKFVLNKLFEMLRTESGTQNTISKILHYAIIVIAVLLGFLSIHLEQFIFLIGGLLGIGLGFALKDVVADFVAGFFVLIERPIEIGNYIQIDNIEGTVQKISARTTTIVNSRNFATFVPNKDLLAKQITNWSHRKFAIGFEIYIRVTHESDPELVRKIILETLQSHPTVLKLPACICRLEEIEADALYFMSRAFISTQRLKESWTIAADLRIKIVKAFKENGIKFAKPQRVVYLNEQTNETRVEEKKPLGIKFDK
ncbi:MAG: mechanosensitive ion channel domain-containing protein [Candidatus Babeliales bacterium]